MTARVARALVALVAAQAFAAAPSRSAEPAPEDPPLCREAIAAHPDESALAALTRAEDDLAARARKARAEAKKILREHLGDGTQGGLAGGDRAEPLMRQADELRRAGKVMCHCRQRRGDPQREDCEFLYPERLP
ncbi:MAG TPA: hypothetical protein VNF72_02665 [Myxococcota bacterium]|nr:hypothetical protein [Myxococcota bacterium]